MCVINKPLPPWANTATVHLAVSGPAECAWQIVPIMALFYIVTCIDRVNGAFAALTMKRDLASARVRTEVPDLPPERVCLLLPTEFQEKLHLEFHRVWFDLVRLNH